MEIHQLRYFVAVAETGGFSRAAQACNVAQPSLSQQIIKLEKQLGSPLFDRLGRRIALTDAGRALLPRARAALASIEDARRAVCDDPEAASPTLRIGAIPTIAPYLIPQVIRAFKAEHPRVRIDFDEDVTDRLIKALLDAELDLAIMSAPIDEPQLRTETLDHEPLYLAAPADHPLAKRANLALKHLNDQPVIVLHEMHCLQGQVDALCRSYHVKPHVTCRTAQLHTVLELIARGVGVSLVPRMCALTHRDLRWTYRPFFTKPPRRAITASTNASRVRSPIADRFLAAVRAELRRQG